MVRVPTNHVNWWFVKTRTMALKEQQNYPAGVVVSNKLDENIQLKELVIN